MLLWLWCGLAAVALIRPLTWELPYAAGAVLKRQKGTHTKKFLPLKHDLLGSLLNFPGGLSVFLSLSFTPPTTLAISQSPLISSFYTLDHYSPAPITPVQGTRQLEIASTTKKLFKLASPKPTYLTTYSPSCRNHNKSSYPHFPFTPSAS